MEIRIGEIEKSIFMLLRHFGVDIDDTPPLLVLESEKDFKALESTILRDSIYRNHMVRRIYQFKPLFMPINKYIYRFRYAF